MSDRGLLVVADLVYAAALAAMVAATLWVAPQIATDTVPMQWGLDGKPTWYAPKEVGLWFTVGLAVVLRVVMLLQAQWGAPRRRKVAVGLMVFSIIVAVVHAGHLVAVMRWAATQ